MKLFKTKNDYIIQRYQKKKLKNYYNKECEYKNKFVFYPHDP
jgi:hypothetical protein